jgi:hypothetical protein
MSDWVAVMGYGTTSPGAVYLAVWGTNSACLLTLLSQLLRNFHFQIVNVEKPWTRLSYLGFVIHDFWVQVSEDTMG